MRSFLMLAAMAAAAGAGQSCRLTLVPFLPGGPSGLDPLTHQVRARLSWFDRGTRSPGWGVAIDKVIWGVIPNE